MTTTIEIFELETKLKESLETDSLIDPKDLKHLYDLRERRVKELVSTHQERLDLVKEKTRVLTEKTRGLTALQLKLNPAILEDLHLAFEKYEIAASRWVIDYPLTPWEQSPASEIASGILILISQME